MDGGNGIVISRRRWKEGRKERKEGRKERKGRREKKEIGQSNNVI